MHSIKIQRKSRLGPFLEGALLTLSPLPLLLVSGGHDGSVPDWGLISGTVATALVFLTAMTLHRRPLLGKWCAALAAATVYTAKLPHITSDPFLALLATVSLIFTGFVISGFHPVYHARDQTDTSKKRLGRAWGAVFAVPFCIVLTLFSKLPNEFYDSFFAVLFFIISQTLVGHWAWHKKEKRHILFLAFSSIIFLVILFSAALLYIPVTALLLAAACVTLLPRHSLLAGAPVPWWEILLNHPARILLISFLTLCFIGTLLLNLPFAAASDTINVIDAAFTAVSAVCVTGLIVLDTPNDFSSTGQGLILLLIQLGGLGIMGVTTVALHAFGKRISLKQERIITAMTDTTHQDLIAALLLILKMTFLVEGIGAVFLTVLFHAAGDPAAVAIWRGIFTAVSAFCNAGFALQTDSLISYRDHTFILHTVAILIVIGGTAPATCLLIPRWMRGERIPIPAKIALVATAALLAAGTVIFLSFEWNGVLQGFSIGDKMQHAWFQSVTLRTAGFNSVDIGQVANPTLLVMVLFMFIGGNPGGTAGGVKTTTVALLAMAFWANINRRDDIIIQSRRVGRQTVYRAVTIVMSGTIFLILAVLMLEATQVIPARDIIFEAASALGTVGLSTGVTGQLDEIGKVIIMVTMFTGRIGPMTLFMLLSSDRTTRVSRCPQVEISLT